MNRGEGDIRAGIDAAKDEMLEPPRPLTREPLPGAPFPIGALGSTLRGAVEGIADRVQTPLPLAGQSVLAAASLIVQPHANVRLPISEHSIRPVSENFITCANSGDRKSSSDDEATWPVHKREAKLREEHDDAMESYLNNKEAWDHARAKAKKDCKGDKGAIAAALAAIGPAPQKPLKPLLTFSEPTIEGLFVLFEEGQPSLGLFTSEGGKFLGGYSMRAETVLHTVTSLSDLWNGAPLKRVRASVPIKVMVGRRLSMHLMIQTALAPQLYSNRILKAQGFHSRLLTTVPESIIGSRLQRPEAPETGPALTRYYARALDLLELKLPLAADTVNELSPRTLELSPAAIRLWKQYADYVELELPAGKAFEPVQALGAKAAEHAARLAAILTLFDNIEAGEISGERLGDGVELAGFYLGEALRLDAAGTGEDESETDDALQRAHKLLQYLQTAPIVVADQVALVDIYQRGPSSIRNKAVASQAMGILEEHGWAIRVAGGAVVNGLKRQDVWKLRVPEKNDGEGEEE
jgi:Protein of unknown function (DUF3987)